ncbi:hypothetical protein [Streptomyces hokutonensis]|uniref:hypothetical protein n=1 Tax=Streptomyces hokutonensis TaxID=1306990 RepID=UPI00380400DA
MYDLDRAENRRPGLPDDGDAGIRGVASEGDRDALNKEKRRKLAGGTLGRTWRPFGNHDEVQAGREAPKQGVRLTGRPVTAQERQQSRTALRESHHCAEYSVHGGFRRRVGPSVQDSGLDRRLRAESFRETPQQPVHESPLVRKVLVESAR